MEYIIYIDEKIFTFCILTLQLFLQFYSPYQVLPLKVTRSKLNYCYTNLVGQKFEVSYSLVFLPKHITQNQPHFSFMQYWRHSEIQNAFRAIPNPFSD